MTLKNLFMLGGVLAGAAYLQNKSRRDRVVGQARGAFDNLKAKAQARAQEIAQKVETRAHSFADSSMTSSAGATTRRDNGVGVGSSGYGGSGGIGGSGNYR